MTTKQIKFDIQKFALNGSFKSNEPSGHYYMVIWSATQSITGNYSDVTAKVYARPAYDVSCDGGGTLTLDGTVYHFYNQGLLRAAQSKLLLTVTKRLSHSVTGYKKLNMSIYASVASLPNESMINYSGSASWDLNTIYR